MDEQAAPSLAPAEAVRKHVLELIEDRRDRYGPQVAIRASWSETPTVICFVYRAMFGEGVIGLRIEVDPQVSREDSATDIVDGDLGEPLGVFYRTLSPPDEHGVRWWSGDPPELRNHSRVDALGRPLTPGSDVPTEDSAP